MKTTWFTIFLTVIFFLAGSCVKNPVTGKRDFMLLSKKNEIAMGKQSDPEVVSFFGLYEDKKLQRFIDNKGQQMADISHRSDLEWHFKIVDSPVVNAFALPGGYVYFTRGILAYFNNEAEFAGVLGHEIGHVTARHSAKQYSKSMLAQVGLVAGMVISPEFAQFADAASQGVGLLFLKFGRDAERQSDRLGVEYSTKIGYDAEEMAEFFLTLSRLSSEAEAAPVPAFLSTHPNPEDRFENVQELAAKWRQKVPGKELKENRNEYLQMIDGMVYGEDPRQGFVENKNFYHPVLKFQFPIPREFTFQNTPQQVQMAHSSGKAIMVLRLGQGESLEAAAQAVLQNNQLEMVESEKVTINGIPGIALLADQKQEQQTIRTLTFLLQYGDNIYNFMGISSLADFNNFYPIFNSTFTNFRPLTDQALIGRKPERIQVKTARQNGTLAQALASENVDKDRMQELAILNGMELDDRVEKGMLFKVVERQ